MNLTRLLNFTQSARHCLNASSRREYGAGIPKPWWNKRHYGETGGGHHKDRPTPEQSTRRIQTSRTLSYILRHGAKAAGLSIRSDGFVSVKDLVRGLPSTSAIKDPMMMQLNTVEFRHLDFRSLEKIVKMDNKRRFTLLYKPATEGTSNQLGSWWIRANQGHSMDSVVDLELKRIISPDEVPMAVHGTSPKSWNKISVEGLSRMTRNHIHLAQGVARGDVISGMRSSARLMIYIDLAKAMAAGLKFYLSVNGVILTEGDEEGYIRPQFFRRVEILRKDYVPIPGWEGPQGEEKTLKDFVEDTIEQETNAGLNSSLPTQERVDEPEHMNSQPHDGKKVQGDLAIL
ncbi:trna 2 -phosphotransferase 1-like [Moniliophthora roreri MCA 2997]|uniref:2'-phosphotransferase n=2 Tax=Moniliophthora roreri TaxID=221103 RepID=V2XSH0_MONRO|nr:trna 2 -phosphotransferase 1-like [Moniliophthora roreri MCA 2997]